MILVLPGIRANERLGAMLDILSVATPAASPYA
jgi:hypothetical protein